MTTNPREGPGATCAPPRVPCTRCKVAHGGCVAIWIATGDVCCAVCDHQPSAADLEAAS